MDILVPYVFNNTLRSNVVPVVSPYRYWRLYITANNADGSYTGIGECEMAIVVGGANVCSGGVVTASTQLNTGTGSAGASAATAFDGIIGVSNGWVTAVGAAIPSWLQYDFGAGVTKAIAEIRLFNQVNQYTRPPKDLTVQASNDGISFDTIKSVTGLTGWVNNVAKVISLP